MTITLLRNINNYNNPTKQMYYLLYYVLNVEKFLLVDLVKSSELSLIFWNSYKECASTARTDRLFGRLSKLTKYLLSQSSSRLIGTNIGTKHFDLIQTDCHQVSQYTNILYPKNYKISSK